jgi:O-antigen/teichoic acid export membrane protein
MNAAVTTAGNFWAIAVTALTLPLTLRGLGVEAFGVWAIIQTFSVFTGWLTLADIGIGTAATRFIAARRAVGDDNGVAVCVSTSLAAFAAIAFGAAGLIGVCGGAALRTVFHVPAGLGHDAGIAVLFFAVQVLFDFVTRASECCLEGLNRVDLSRGLEMVRRTIVVATVAAVAHTGGGLVGAAAASAIVSGPVSALSLVLLHRELRPHAWSAPAWAELGKLFEYGREIAVLKPIGVVHRMMDRVIVGAALGPASVSLVEVATQVQAGADSILSAASYAVVPGASWLDARGEKAKLAELQLRGTRLSVLATMPLVVLPAMFAPELLRVWMGPSQHAAAPLVVLGLVYIGVTAPAQVSSNLLVGVGHARSVLWPSLMAVAVNLAASIALVHLIGVPGAFVGTLVASPIVIALITRAALHLVEVDVTVFARDVIRPLLPPCAALLGTSAAFALAPLSDLTTIVIGGAVGLLVYAVSSVYFAFDPSERAQLRHARSRVRRRAEIASTHEAAAR